jgi:hypothetical protein
MVFPCLWTGSLLLHLKIILTRAANGAGPIIRKIFKRCPRGYPAIGVTQLWIVDIPADRALPFRHFVPLSTLKVIVSSGNHLAFDEPLFRYSEVPVGKDNLAANLASVDRLQIKGVSFLIVLVEIDGFVSGHL